MYVEIYSIYMYGLTVLAFRKASNNGLFVLFDNEIVEKIQIRESRSVQMVELVPAVRIATFFAAGFLSRPNIF